MRVTTCLSVFAVLVALALAQPFHGAQYEQQSAEDKAQQLYKAILASRVPGTFYSAEDTAAQMLIENMKTTFDTVADDMPKQFAGLETRQKVIHSVAAHGFVKWVPAPNAANYTGIFSSGCSNVLIRMSSAFNPVIDDTNTTLHIAPGIALKCLRDSIPSINTVALYSLEGQVSFNFFAHDLSNHVADIPSTAGIGSRIIRERFATASKFPVMVGLSGFASSDESGKTIPSPRFPWRLIFHPQTFLHQNYPDQYPGSAYYDQLSATLRPGPLYKIYAIDNPAQDSDVSSAVYIGDLILTTPVTPSIFGDRHLFYQHFYMESDLALHPEWTAPAQAIMAKQQSMQQFYLYPDLPFN